uniref:Protein FRA10AC1 homolog n=1 Tax=Syphacia muris TaxID=451379 RepID=A0A0N5A8L9_9BILA
MSKRNPDIGYDDLESEFDYGSEIDRKKRRKNDDLFKKDYPGTVPPVSHSDAKKAFDIEHANLERQKRRLMSLDVYSRHKELINQYFLYYPGATKRLQRDTSKDRNDYDVLRENHRFLWDETELAEAAEKSWEARLAKRYYDKLFKEYCIADLSQYKKNRVALRWRIEKEVRSGKGQFECGNKHCLSKEDLTSWEVNFGYVENGQKKNALIKLRLCPKCSTKLNFYSKKRKARNRKKVYEPSTDKADSYSNSPKEVSEKEEQKFDEKPEQNEKTGDSSSTEINKESSEENDKVKMEAEKMAQIWKKTNEPVDPERIVEAELDDFLEDLLI